MNNIRRTFGCGVDGESFRVGYQGLSEEDRSRLWRVANRVWLTLKLRYETGFYNNPFPWGYEGYALRHIELPSIEVYLLCACLDTLAGKPVYRSFERWMREQPNAIDLSVKDVVRLYSSYMDEYGVGRNLRALFRNLPQSAKEWLASNVVIRRSDQPLAPYSQNIDKLLDRLYRYFYQVRRNAFTHGSVSLPTPIAEDIQESLDGEWWVTPVSGTHFSLYRDRPEQKWNLSYRQGLDEATILRIIIYAVAIQMLGIELSSRLIDTNLRNYSRLDTLYAFIGEVNRNSTLASLWERIDEVETSDLRLELIHSGIPLLRTESSMTMVERYLDNQFESQLRQMTSQYLIEVNHINSSVSSFNEANPPPSSGYDRAERWRVIKNFLDDLVRTASYKAIVKWPSRNEMRSVWLVIRDPCYTIDAN